MTERITMTRKEEAELNRMLANALTPPDENGFVSYLDGLNDEAMLGMLGEAIPEAKRLNRQHVAGYRLDMYGKVRDFRGKKGEGEERKIKELEEKITQLNAWVIALALWAKQRPRAPFDATEVKG